MYRWICVGLDLCHTFVIGIIHPLATGDIAKANKHTLTKESQESQAVFPSILQQILTCIKQCVLNIDLRSFQCAVYRAGLHTVCLENRPGLVVKAMISIQNICTQSWVASTSGKRPFLHLPVRTDCSPSWESLIYQWVWQGRIWSYIELFICGSPEFLFHSWHILWNTRNPIGF